MLRAAVACHGPGIQVPALQASLDIHFYQTLSKDFQSTARSGAPYEFVAARRPIVDATGECTRNARIAAFTHEIWPLLKRVIGLLTVRLRSGSKSRSACCAVRCVRPVRTMSRPGCSLTQPCEGGPPSREMSLLPWMAK